MSFQRSGPMVGIGNAQIIMSSLKQFERKLDKLQDDVDFHGRTLTELRSLVSGLSAGTVMNPDVRTDENNSKRMLPNKPKNNAMQQYEEASYNSPAKAKIKQAVQPLPSKIQEKWLGKNSGPPKKIFRCSPCLVTHKASSPTSIPVRNSTKSFKTRLSKAEAPRKATTLRTQKVDKRSIIST